MLAFPRVPCADRPSCCTAIAALRVPCPQATTGIAALRVRARQVTSLGSLFHSTCSIEQGVESTVATIEARAVELLRCGAAYVLRLDADAAAAELLHARTNCRLPSAASSAAGQVAPAPTLTPIHNPVPHTYP